MRTLSEDIVDTLPRDFFLYLTDGEAKMCLEVHRVVLIASSPFFRRTVGAFDHMSVLHVPEGLVSAAVSVIRYMYTRHRPHLSYKSRPVLKQLEMHVAPKRREPGTQPRTYHLRPRQSRRRTRRAVTNYE